MKKLLLIILTGLLLLTACGQKGSLYLPESTDDENSEEETQNTTG